MHRGKMDSLLNFLTLMMVEHSKELLDSRCEGIVSKEIGYGNATGWRAKYPDSGTIYQRGQEFEEKTINQMTPVAKKIFAEKVKEGLDL